MRLLDACARKPVDATPVWLMRQAGRYLPEYRAIREQMSFVEMCRRPDIAAEVTLQPLRRFDLDAAIVFADILLPLEPMGIGFHFNRDDGPVIERPIRTARDLEGVHGIRAASDSRGRYTVRFYIVAILFVIFDVETIFLYPWAVRYRQLGWFGVAEVAVFLAILVVGYIWAWKKGAFEWV